MIAIFLMAHLIVYFVISNCVAGTTVDEYGQDVPVVKPCLFSTHGWIIVNGTTPSQTDKTVSRITSFPPPPADIYESLAVEKHGELSQEQIENSWKQTPPPPAKNMVAQVEADANLVGIGLIVVLIAGLITAFVLIQTRLSSTYVHHNVTILPPKIVEKKVVETKIFELGPEGLEVLNQFEGYQDFFWSWCKRYPKELNDVVEKYNSNQRQIVREIIQLAAMEELAKRGDNHV